MPEVLALPLLYDAVETRFTDEATPCTLAFGWNENVRQLRGPRIVVSPGDDVGTVGVMLGAQQPGRNVRSLGTLMEVFTVTVSTEDAADPRSDRAQYTACRLLFDAWWRAAWLYAGARLVLVSARWLVERTTARAGAALQAVCTIEAMIPDAALDETTASVAGLFTVTELDAEQTLTIPAV